MPGSREQKGVKLPAVSVQLPAGYSDTYIRRAITCFLSQDYKGQLELVVLDNNEHKNIISHLLPKDKRIKYFHAARAPLGKLRNQANALATGSVIVHFDEDDWSAPDRISFQVQRLLTSGKALTGFHAALFYDMDHDATYKYFYEAPGRNHPPYSFGSAHCYLKSFWERHMFVETGIEDWPFTQLAREEGQIDSCDGGGKLVVVSHGDSICYPQFGHTQFPKWERSEFPKEFFASLAKKGVTPTCLEYQL